jgi:hypothetical protein
MIGDRRHMRDDFDLLVGRRLLAETEVLGEPPASMPLPSLQTSRGLHWNEIMIAL